uniref:[Ala1,Thr6,Asp11]-phyllokinin n=1 Tax=Physalaemus signifer TaxID=364768 RepID=BRK7_PHYSG|nr:RecName: Full=[Ala1,Thr6,Asp11]-phyllokinin [Physalaemus signifer]
APPGFTPFRID